MPYNKVLNVSDYAKNGRVCRKEWEVDMAINTLLDMLYSDHTLGGVNEAEVLGVGAGHEATIFRLSNYVKRVWATDLYAEAGDWKANAPTSMLVQPELFAPQGEAFELNRIVVQHMNMLDLRYTYDSFDAVFSSGSIEHVGSFEDVSRAAAEIGRVVKPGGVVSLSTEWKISGEGIGWDGVLLFDDQTLRQYIIEPMGCALIDPLVTRVDEDTLATAYPLQKIVDTGKLPELEGVLTHKGYTFTSVHLALRKPL